jgi:hypothetical protein
VATDPAAPEGTPPGARLERDLAEIEYLARVGPDRWGLEGTLIRLRESARAARERYEQATPPAERGSP